MRFTLATISGFLAAFIANTLIALFILGPWLNIPFQGFIRTEEQGLNMPAILSGYLILGLFLAYIYPRIDIKLPWAGKAILVGAIIGLAIFGAGHLIITGWGDVPAFPMIMSGFLDSLSMVAGTLAVAFAYRVRQKKLNNV